MNTLSLFPDLALPAPDTVPEKAAQKIAQAAATGVSVRSAKLKRRFVDDTQVRLDPHMHIAKRLADDLAEQYRRARYRSPRTRNTPTHNDRNNRSNDHQSRSSDADKVVVAICEHLRASLRDQIAAERH